MRRLWFLSVGALALSCIGDLDPRTLVSSPRILDIIAEPPEVGPGGTITLRPILGGTHGTPEFHWTGCISADPNGIPLGTSGFGATTYETGCIGDASTGALPLGDGATATLVAPPGVLDQVELAAARFGGQLSPATLRRLLGEVGLVLGVGLEVRVDGRTLHGYKRVVLSRNAHPNRNPPPPRFTIQGVPVAPSPTQPDVCAPIDGAPLHFRRARTLSLVPDPNDRAWFERYTVIEATGDLATRTETAFYSWYATSGDLALGLTRTPIRDNQWNLPDGVGPASLWLLVRDGHGGSSGCRLDLQIE